MQACLLAATPALQMAPLLAVPAMRLVSPVMQTIASASQGTADAGSQAPPASTLPAEPAVLVQGGSLRTWSYRSPAVEQVQVILSTEGRPLDADIELWHGPDNTPCKMRIYGEDGDVRPFNTVIETPRGPNTVAIRNIGQLEFPFAADVYANDVEDPSAECTASQSAAAVCAHCGGKHPSRACPKRALQPCRAFQLGHCPRGDACRFAHVR